MLLIKELKAFTLKSGSKGFFNEKLKDKCLAVLNKFQPQKLQQLLFKVTHCLEPTPFLESIAKYSFETEVINCTTSVNVLPQLKWADLSIALLKVNDYLKTQNKR